MRLCDPDHGRVLDHRVCSHGAHCLPPHHHLPYDGTHVCTRGHQQLYDGNSSFMSLFVKEYQQIIVKGVDIDPIKSPYSTFEGLNIRSFIIHITSRYM